METIGKRIAEYRKNKNLKQDELAESLGVSPQAVSKWENDLSCPDIMLLPKLAKLLGTTVDELLSGKQEPETYFLPEEKRKDINDLMFRIVCDSKDGDKVRVKIPCALIKAAAECGIDAVQISGNDALKSIDFQKLFEMIEKGAMGNLIEVESSDGDLVSIYVE